MAKGNRTWIQPQDSELPEGWMPDTGEPIAEIRNLDPFAAYQALLEEMMSAAWALYRFGGIISFAASRREIAPQMYDTDGYAITWDSYGPTRRINEPKAKVEAVADDLPEAEVPQAEIPAEPPIPQAPIPEPAPQRDRTVPASPDGRARSVPPSPTLAGDEDEGDVTAIPEIPISELADVFGG